MINANNYDLSEVKIPIECEKIMRILPQQHPLLLVDRVLYLSARRIVAIKTVTTGEFCMTGHFPGEPVFPGVYTLESCAQVATLFGYYMYCHPSNSSEFQLAVRMVGVDDVKFKREIRPGDVLKVFVIHTEKRMVGKSAFHSFKAVGYVDKMMVVEAKMRGYFYNRLDREVSIQD